jgi:hypothetical protein
MLTTGRTPAASWLYRAATSLSVSMTLETIIDRGCALQVGSLEYCL